MKTIIAGSRHITDKQVLLRAIACCPWKITGVVCGGARGVDTLGEWWAAKEGIPVYYFKAEWNRYGLSAGYLRNLDMAKAAEALLAIWDGKSKGTHHMIDIAEKQGLRMHVHMVNASYEVIKR